MRIDIKLLDPRAILPKRSKPDDAGADLSSLDEVTLAPGARAVIKTGISMAIPPGYYGRVAPRSGLSIKHGLTTLAGVVDCGYTGDVSVVLVNLGQESITLPAGSRVAQIIIETCAPATWNVVDQLPDSARGADGWGSSGA